MDPWEKVIRIVDRFGVSLAVLSVVFLMFIGLVPSPITSTASEVRAHVSSTRRLHLHVAAQTELMGLACASLAKNPAACGEVIRRLNQQLAEVAQAPSSVLPPDEAWANDLRNHEQKP